ncbi:histidine kinase [Pseudoalteromonas sp.]|uniref:sensor histidine kinase n=1 Tax=Pseudoalteromonas sp. TaxID=53249 RepID=UPI001BD00481|nr:histidine kinase [Pseudoalteromonas sp.]
MGKPLSADALLYSALFNERGVLAALIVTQVVAIILAFAPNASGDIWLHLGAISLLLHLTVLVSSSFLYLCRRFLEKQTRFIQLSFFITSYVLSTAVFSLVFSDIAFDIEGEIPLVFFVLRNCIIVLLITLLFVQFLLIHFEKEQQTKALSRAELDALQARIRPHFLYNSLNTAAELTHHNVEAAEHAILALAALSQAAMRSGQSVLLSDEITLTKQYISLESWRFAERLKVEWLLPEHLPALYIPYLTLQPLVENAVCHGIEPSPSGATISIELHVTTHYLTLIVTNPIPIKVVNTREHNGMALDNIRSRLSIYYKGRAQLTITNKNNQFRVKVVIPKHAEKTL